LRSNFDRASLLAPKAFFCYFFAALGKKVEDISAKICTSTVFLARPNPPSAKIGSAKTLWMFSANPN
jgi:hypothetical protein